MRDVRIETPEIALGAFLKFAGVAPTGSAAKHLVRSGRVRVNGAPEFRRGRKLRPGDTVEAEGAGRFRVVAGRRQADPPC